MGRALLRDSSDAGAAWVREQAQETADQPLVGYAAGRVCSILFIPQYPGLLDAAGVDCWSDPLGKLCLPRGQAWCVALVTRWRFADFKFLRADGGAGNAAARAPLAACLRGLGIRDLSARRMGRFAP